MTSGPGPPAIVPPLVGALGRVSPERADTLRLVTWSMLHDRVGEPVGTRTLLAFYERHAAEGRVCAGPARPLAAPPGLWRPRPASAGPRPASAGPRLPSACRPCHTGGR
ncbi:MAG: hypothetical protein DI576_09985 [Actinomyces sp.]|nr:MAG: hypothetical protein DI576_09985 [Actinomyces sp.]